MIDNPLDQDENKNVSNLSKRNIFVRYSFIKKLNYLFINMKLN